MIKQEVNSQMQCLFLIFTQHSESIKFWICPCADQMWRPKGCTYESLQLFRLDSVLVWCTNAGQGDRKQLQGKGFYASLIKTTLFWFLGRYVSFRLMRECRVINGDCRKKGEVSHFPDSAGGVSFISSQQSNPINQSSSSSMCVLVSLFCWWNK